MSPESWIEEAARAIAARPPLVALTGAGISVESGIPPFRSPGGLWEKFDPTVYASIETFRRDPSKYWSIRGDFIRRLDDYAPNAGHLALAELERAGLLRHLITQNIDGLHQKAGSRSVTELHGNLREILCLACNRRYLAPRIPPGTPPRCDDCGGVLKPNTVLFGEALPAEALERAIQEAATCGCLLVVGTSAVVQPAASLPRIARGNGALVVEVNLERSPAGADLFLEGAAGVILPRLAAALRDRREHPTA
ncbi:MAG: NAD-dependent deacylase [Desulfobacterales bacterium]